MRRVHNWPELLAAFFVDRGKVPFEWGVNDCGLFACDAVKLMTGLDLAAEVRGKYDDEDSAASAMDGGLEPFADHVASKHGILEIPVKMARRGDLALHASLAGITLGIVGLSGLEIVAPGVSRFVIATIPQIVQSGETTEYHYEPSGLKTYPLLECSKAWRI